MIKKIILFFLAFYQRFLTLFSYGSCRFYPTCSQYSIQQFETNSLFKAIYFTIVRILKCNQLFNGGIDYPKVKLNLHNIQYKKIDVKYWYIPDGNNQYLIIKNWNYKNEKKH
jgi:putative membrane protein insertion efficiency factor